MTAINAHHTSRHNATAPQTGRTGDRVELTHYTVANGGERILYGQRVNGSVRVTDVPRTPGGRAYLVERDLQLDGNTALRALVSDYLLCRTRHKQMTLSSAWPVSVATPRRSLPRPSRSSHHSASRSQNRKPL